MNEELQTVLNDVGNAATVAANETIGKVTASFMEFLQKIMTWENLFKIVGVLLIIGLIWLIFKIIRKAVGRIPESKLSGQQRMIVHKVLSYSYKIILLMYVLNLFGIKLSAIWGAAGIAGVALGFAAQTSVSNLISGLFVLSEKTMKIGDFISVDGQSGTVDSIGLLSIKIHTTDNQMIRIPNSTIINSNFQNNNFFEKRRMCFDVSIDYNTDMDTALEILSKVPSMCPSVLAEPAPAAWYTGFGDSAINMTLAVWFYPSDLTAVRNEVFINTKKAFDEANINIPFGRYDITILDNPPMNVENSANNEKAAIETTIATNIEAPVENA